MAEESLILRMRAAGDRATARGAERVARAIDDIGDQAGQAARKVAKLNRETSKTRVNFGPFSTSMRFATLAVGGFILGAQKAVPLTLALAEGIGTAGAAAGGAGAVGLTAFAQGTLAAKLGAADLTAALGGNKQAFKRLTPEARRLFNALSAGQDELTQTAQKNLFPGLSAGAKLALRNLPVVNRIVGDTSKTLGGLARSAGAKLGSKSWGRDLGDIGRTNTKIISNLGHAGLNLAGGFKDIVHEAGPLALWLSKIALRGSKLTETWLGNARATGKMSRFFREGRRDLTLIASATGHLTGGVLNLFGNRDVNGTNTLRNLDALTAKFDEWTRRVQGKPLGQELEKQMEVALGNLASFIGSHLGKAGLVAAKAFWNAFWHADVWGKGITALWLANKLGLTKGVLKGLGGLVTGSAGKGGAAGAVLGRGSSVANPMYVFVVNNGLGGAPGVLTGSGGKGGKLGRAAKALRFIPQIGAAAVGVGAANKILGPDVNTSELQFEANAKKWQTLSKFLPLQAGFNSLSGALPGAGGTSGFTALPIIIEIDGKTIATAVARQGTRKKSTK